MNCFVFVLELLLKGELAMKKKLQVFVSSTYEDMKEERQKAVEAILAAGHIPAGMELFASENNQQWNVIQRWIRESDVFLILLGGRYGSIEPTSGKSYIHKEFEYAVEKRKPIMSVVISEEFLNQKIYDGKYPANFPVETSNPNYIMLKKQIRSKMSSEYSDIGQVSAAISRMFANNTAQFDKCSGWISGKEAKKMECDILSRYSGISKASIGLDRDAEFRKLRDRAKKEIYIIGAGMSKLSRLAQNSLENQLKHVPIHLYMMDPEYLENNQNYAALVETFFGMQGFAKIVRMSYDSLKVFCELHNSNPLSKNKITLSTYTTIPTMSMVLIDPNTRNAELSVEYFTYRCGEERPLFLVKKGAATALFDSLSLHATHLIGASAERVK